MEEFKYFKEYRDGVYEYIEGEEGETLQVGLHGDYASLLTGELTVELSPEAIKELLDILFKVVIP